MVLMMTGPGLALFTAAGAAQDVLAS